MKTQSERATGSREAIASACKKVRAENAMITITMNAP
jgi:hypothetical protein